MLLPTFQCQRDAVRRAYLLMGCFCLPKIKLAARMASKSFELGPEGEGKVVEKWKIFQWGCEDIPCWGAAVSPNQLWNGGDKHVSSSCQSLQLMRYSGMLMSCEGASCSFPLSRLFPNREQHPAFCCCRCTRAGCCSSYIWVHSPESFPACSGNAAARFDARACTFRLSEQQTNISTARKGEESRLSMLPV